MNIFLVVFAFHSVLASNSTLNSEKNKLNWNWTQTINSKLKKKGKKKRTSTRDDRTWWNVSNIWLFLTISSWVTWRIFVQRVVTVGRCGSNQGARGFYHWLGRRWSAGTGSFFSCRCRHRSWRGPEWKAFGSGRGEPPPGGSSAEKTSHFTFQWHKNYNL